MTLKQLFVHTLWCDDIRQEIGNKPSFMGVYTAGLLLPQLPIKIARLSLFSWVCTPPGQAADKISFEVLRDDGFVILQMEQVGQLNSAANTLEGATRQAVSIGMSIGNVDIPEDCKYLVTRATVSGEVAYGPRLMVTANAPAFETLLGIGQQQEKLADSPTSGPAEDMNG